MLWTSMTVIGWFACKSLSDWVRYLVIVTCTGKSGIFRGQPVSLRGSNPDYSGRSTSRVKKRTGFRIHFPQFFAKVFWERFCRTGESVLCWSRWCWTVPLHVRYKHVIANTHKKNLYSHTYVKKSDSNLRNWRIHTTSKAQWIKFAFPWFPQINKNSTDTTAGAVSIFEAHPVPLARKSENDALTYQSSTPASAMYPPSSLSHINYYEQFFRTASCF